MDQNIKNEPPKKRKRWGVFKSFVDIRAWSSYDEIKTNTKSIYRLFLRLFSQKPNQTIRQETFEATVLKLNLTEEQINERKKIFLYSVLIYLAITLILIAYVLYLIKILRIVPAMFVLILTVFMAALTYREHLWYIQMSKRKFGCSFVEWLEFVFGK